MSTLNVLITSREKVKPSSPTPESLRIFKLSVLDQIAPPAFVPMILYYAPNGDSKIKNSERISRLKESLSRTLTTFYPLAGRVNENSFIDCNDEGVDFIEAQVNCALSDILRQPDTEVLDRLLPQDYHVSIPAIEVQMGFQVNIFSCGGMAIGTSISHKLVDGFTFGTFANFWAAMARGSENYSSPIFVGSHYFPPRDLSRLLPTLDIPKAKTVTKRFVFDSSRIASLKAKSFSNVCIDHLSRIEIVSALIWKCAMEVSRARSGSLRPSCATHTVNLRARMDPPLPDCAAGNLLWLAIAPAPSVGTITMELHDLVIRVRDAIKKLGGDFIRKMQGEDGFSVLGETLKQVGEYVLKDVDLFRFTSLRSFRLQEADFGWGKPIWVSSAGLTFKNVIFLMETSGADRIEAWVTLDEQDMLIFERNQEICSFDSTSQSASFLLLNSHL